VEESRLRWVGAGVVAGSAGLATSYAAAMVLTIREAPVVAVAEMVIRVTPGPVTERAISLLGAADKGVLIGVILLLLLGLFALAGLLARRSWWHPLLVWVPLGLVGGAAVLLQRGASVVDLLPVVTGLVTWVVCLSALSDPLRRRGGAGLEVRERRVFLMVAGVMAVAAAGVAIGGRVVGSSRRHVEESRRLLRLVGVSLPRVPARSSFGIPGITPWQTPSDDFYLIHTAIGVPTIEPHEWSLRIHGMVDRELTLTYQDLVQRRLTESWITLSCVSNPVGGDLVGNAWWSGVRLADILAGVGVHPDADAVLQTSEDGWTCATPLEALTDERDAMLAVGMNGRPLPIEHGFPVRTIVPGLYGYVSATKWVVDLEVTRFDRVEAFWTQRGWSERGPVKLTSRIDLPRGDEDVAAGPVRVGGVAWAQHTGIARVEVALDGGPWTPAEIAPGPTDDTWVQWLTTLEVPAGEHLLRVRATDKEGRVQTGVERDVVPDGATGWHEVSFSAADAADQG
jgi:DMSO/TMAO reductase YedYZ molybdopterin-dependent catalytic subunit